MSEVAGAAISAGLGLGKAIVGGIQSRRARKELEGLDRPEYQIPEELKQNLSQAELQALEGMPAEQKAQAVQNLQRTMAASLAAQAGRKGGLSGIGSIAQSQSDAFTNLISQDAAMRQQNRQGLMDARTAMAQQQQQQFQINQMDPYQQQLQALQGRFAAGQQTLFSGIEDIAGAGTTYAGAGGFGFGGGRNLKN